MSLLASFPCFLVPFPQVAMVSVVDSWCIKHQQHSGPTINFVITVSERPLAAFSAALAAERFGMKPETAGASGSKRFQHIFGDNLEVLNMEDKDVGPTTSTAAQATIPT